MMKKYIYSFIILTATLVVGCKHHPNYNGDVVVESSCDPQTVYFQNTILPLLNSHCAMAGCHNAATNAEGVNVTSYTAIMNSNGEGQLVSPFNPNNSKLYEVILDGSMPPYPYAALSGAEMQLIYDWINQGAQNNYCADCDTTKFQFGADIFPIISTKCSGCHGAISPSGLTTILNYANVKTLADNGKLLGVVTGVGYSIMPPTVGLPSCEKTKILKWLNNGAPNN